MPTNSTTAAGASDEGLYVATFERLALEAGRLVMEVFNGAMAVEQKADASPVTEADRASERLILEGLRTEFPGIPCVAEEEASCGLLPTELGDTFFLVDPLDGTREFVRRNADFTVNIALVRQGVPVVGVVYAPASGRLFSGRSDHAEAAEVGANGDVLNRHRIHVREGATPLTIVASRSHIDEETLAYLGRFEAAEIISVGSSLKFCLLAAAEADLYPRFGRTMEWDTAAGDAVLRAAGGATVTLDGAPLNYGKTEANFANPPFISCGRLAKSPL
ncbi:3'(2'),5'-bisphosphate nucleotidase CysQ [Arvimicrobium flavum]|uniref:3'(2'),5'-bisphosphate nucleotidase CysQ n=1 Tax=Arvimicrobium flavum TaxID=3393320 RepID=UPI00237BB495|nr:3'(2'),5'-bisphosphate nucleotidase CysQ [Mesorhizobium shangrilense]